MKQIASLLTFSLAIFFLTSASAEASSYAVKVFSEPGAEERAQEYIDKMKLLEPFKQLLAAGVFVINDSPVVVTSTNCRGGSHGIERLAQCNTSEVSKFCDGADLCPIFTSFPLVGAGGSPYPISSSSFPWTTMLHEVIHTFGFSDEYAYTKRETGTYCGGWKDTPNERQLSRLRFYDSEEKARKACVKLISWCEEAIKQGSQIATKAPNGKWIIGSPEPVRCPNNILGVYLGAGCMKKSPETTYRPYFCPTVMGFPTIGQDNCEVQERHHIIGRMPEILPDYYQRVLFEKITFKAGVKNLKFVSTPTAFPEAFSYGIPEVDRLAEGSATEGKTCSKN